ncbi:MAG: type II/IV secretion system protein, partial [Pirellulaceae bacterium]
MITEAGEILLRRGLLEPDQLQLARQRAQGGSVIESAIQQGFVKEEAALQALAEEVGLDYVDLRQIDIDLELLKQFPQKLIYRHAIFPIRRDGSALVVATSNPLDLYPLDEASATTGLMITPVVAERDEIAKL